MFWMVVPTGRLPSAMNWVVSPIKLADELPGMRVMLGVDEVPSRRRSEPRSR